MDEDSFELVPKNTIKKLKDENSELKQQLEIYKTKVEATSNQKVPEVDYDKIISDIIKTLHEESQKERELILDHLTEIKDLNKTTLNNLLDKTEKLDTRLESMINTLSDLIQASREIISEVSNSDNQEIKEVLEKLVEVNSEEKESIEDFEKIKEKIDDIEKFMNNLSILLSYVKPADFTMDKNFSQ